MYYLFIEHDILPGDYYRLPAGEKVVLRAFFEMHMEHIGKRAENSGSPRYNKKAIKLRR